VPIEDGCRDGLRRSARVRLGGGDLHNELAGGQARARGKWCDALLEVGQVGAIAEALLEAPRRRPGRP
jgi:hypothetical protein